MCVSVCVCVCVCVLLCAGGCVCRKCGVTQYTGGVVPVC